MTRKPYPSGMSDEEWHFVAPYLALIDEQAPQRRYSLRAGVQCASLAGPGRRIMAQAAH